MMLFKKQASVAFACILFLLLLPFAVWVSGTSASAVEENTRAANVIGLKYGDRYSLGGYDSYSVVDAGVPTSYKVGYGVKKGTRDDAVITVKDGTLYATGIGKGVISLTVDGKADNYTVIVEKAPVSMFLLIGQSNMSGHEGSPNQSVACENGQVYSTCGLSSLLNSENGASFVPSALEGEYSKLSTDGKTELLSNNPVNILTQEGSGKRGLDAGLAYQWNKMTGDKVWVINAAHGGSVISEWVKGAPEYNEAVNLFKAAQKVMASEIAAGHYELKNYGYFWLQGCSDGSITAENYYTCFVNMHKYLKADLAYDFDADGTKEVFEFCDIILPRAGGVTQSCTPYRRGEYTDTTNRNYFTTFLDLEMRAPRVVQYYLCNMPGNDINLVCNVSDSWAYMPDGSDGVEEYFKSNYPNGRVDYPTQKPQSEEWRTPTIPEDVHSKIHYNQIGYNELGIVAARNAAYTHGRAEKPDVPVTVTFYDWTGYRKVDELDIGCGKPDLNLIVPVVCPVYESKSVTYKLSDDSVMDYKFYDLTVKTEYNKDLTLKTSGASAEKTLKLNGSSNKHLFASYTRKPATYLENAALVSVCELCSAVRTYEYENTRLKLSKPAYFIASTTDKTVTLTWEKMTGATGYRIYLKNKSTGNWKILVSSTADTTYSFKNLKPGESYTFAVKAYAKGDETLWATSYATLTVKALKASDNTVKASSVTKNSVKLTWSKVKGAYGYRVYRLDNVSGKWETVVNSTSSTSAAISGLKPSETCVFAVRYYTKSGSKTVWSSFSSMMRTTVITLPEATNKITSHKGNYTVTLKWNEVASASGYRVFIKTEKGWSAVATTTSNSYRVKALIPGTKYTFSVRSYVKTGNITTWSSDYVSHAAYTVPVRPTVINTQAGSNSITLSWSKTGNETGYRVYVYNYQGGKWERVVNSTTRCTVTVKGLESGKTYLFAVKSYLKTDSGVVWSESYKSVKAATK